MIEIDSLKGVIALRTMVKEEELDQAAAELLKKARALEALPSTMEFKQMPEYEETGEYHIVLWCG